MVARLNANINEILRMPDVVERLKTFSVIPVGGEPILLGRKVQEDRDLFTRLVKEFNIRAE